MKSKESPQSLEKQGIPEINFLNVTELQLNFDPHGIIHESLPVEVSVFYGTFLEEASRELFQLQYITQQLRKEFKKNLSISKFTNLTQ